MNLPVRLFIKSRDGLLAFGPEHARMPLPWGLDRGGPVLTYGPYLNALASFLGQSDYQPLRTALSRLLGRPISLPEVQDLEVISQKHGAFYHVAQARAKISGEYYSLAINSAVRTEQQAFLESEFTLLQHLNKRFPLGLIPRTFALGISPYAAEDGSVLALKSFIAEWFDGYHEFHLSRRSLNEIPVVKVWDGSSGETALDAQQTRLLYHRAAAILTAYLDGESFSQIYPWHHAAGDFVLARREQGVEVRLITVRGYQPLVSVGSDPSEKWIPLVHFFLNMSLRMRLDRLDGTGDLAWAGVECLQGVVSGFLECWEQKARENSSLPRSSEVWGVLRSFAREEWLSLAELVLVDGLLEEDETEFIQPRLEEHVTSLCRVLSDEGV